MSKEDLIFTYQGVVNDVIVGDILQLVESALNAEEIKSKVKRKIFRVLLEGIQNLYKHQNEISEGENSEEEVTTVLIRNSGHYTLIFGNYIAKSEVDTLRERIDLINTKDKSQLREQFIETLNDNERTKDGGSGLGLMDIARKSGQPLSYEFDEVSQKLTYFKLIVKINKDG